MTRPANFATEVVETPLGAILLAASGQGLLLCEFLDGRSPRRLLDKVRREDPGGEAMGEGAARRHLRRAVQELRSYFSGTLTRFTVPLDLRGAPFELEVWQELRRIPYGRLTSYGRIAERLKRPGAARAVGAANARNPIAVVIPCHRVVGADGRLVGYGGGLDRKVWLLEHEGALVKTL